MSEYKPFRTIAFALSLAAAGCHAQVPVPSPAGVKVSPDLARRVEVMIRSRTEIPPQYEVRVGERTKSEVAGYDAISVIFADGANVSKPLTFLLSADGKTLAQFNKFDISQDPKLKIPPGDRPSRGGPTDAPVTIVLFDDLECPFCAKMHAEMFPAVTDRYKSQVRVVYHDFPLDQHPWAMRAAIDANCVAAQNQAGYWQYVDYVHAHAAEFGGEAKSLDEANKSLDKLASDTGAFDKDKATVLAACINKQDDTAVQASKKEAEALGVNSTPALFINGEKVEGAIPMEYVYRMIDNAIAATGQTPPPPFVPLVVVTPPAAKPGS